MRLRPGDQVAAIVAFSVTYHTAREGKVLAREASGYTDWWLCQLPKDAQYGTTLSVQYALNQLTFGNSEYW